jgi:hypothetical protein
LSRARQTHSTKTTAAATDASRNGIEVIRAIESARFSAASSTPGRPPRYLWTTP